MENHGLNKKALEHSRRIRETAFSALVDPFVSWLSVLMARRDCSGISGFIGL